jgi:hypothetical protein
MESNSHQELIPQQVEKITKLQWVAKNKIASMLTNSYPSIADVLHTAEDSGK